MDGIVLVFVAFVRFAVFPDDAYLAVALQAAAFYFGYALDALKSQLAKKITTLA